MEPVLGYRALVAQRIERCPAEAEVVGSNPAKRTIIVSTGQPRRPCVKLPEDFRQRQREAGQQLFIFDNRVAAIGYGAAIGAVDHHTAA